MAKSAGTTSERREISYIVRVYRCDAERMAGMVELPVQERRTPFRSFAQLRAILTGTFPDRVPTPRNREPHEK